MTATPSPDGCARARVIVYDIATADGRVALSPDVLVKDDPRWPQYEAGGYANVLRRHNPEALLEGAGTFVLPRADAVDGSGAVQVANEDGAGASAPVDGHYLPADVVAATRRWFVVVDSRGRVTWPFTTISFPGWEQTSVLVLVSAATPTPYLAYLQRERIPFIVAGVDRVDLAAALAVLRAELGVATVVATCGGELGGALLRAGLIDQLEIEVLPIAVGGRHTPVLLSANDLPPNEWPTSLRLTETTVTADGRVLLSYAVEREEH